MLFTCNIDVGKVTKAPEMQCFELLTIYETFRSCSDIRTKMVYNWWMPWEGVQFCQWSSVSHRRYMSNILSGLKGLI